LLQKVRSAGDWESWLRFFLQKVEETSNQAAETAKEILQLFDADRRRLESVGRAANSALRVQHLLQCAPIVSIQRAADQLQLTIPTVTTALKHLQKLGIIEEVTGRQRNRLFVYKKYLNILNQGTEPLPKR